MHNIILRPSDASRKCRRVSQVRFEENCDARFAFNLVGGVARAILQIKVLHSKQFGERVDDKLLNNARHFVQNDAEPLKFTGSNSLNGRSAAAVVVTAQQNK